MIPNNNSSSSLNFTYIWGFSMFLIILSATLLLLFIVSIGIVLKVENIDDLKQICWNILNKNQSIFSSLFQVDETSNNHGGHLVATVLKAHGVKEVFTLCGGHISPILTAAEAIGIEVIDTRHEATAVFAADAVARLRQSIGVAIVTAGPGLTNTVTAAKNAQMAESAVIILCGGAPTLLTNRGALQGIDQMALFRPICKLCVRVTKLREIIPSLRQAICIAQSDTPGPVLLEFPIDTLYPYHIVMKEMEFAKRYKSWKEAVTNCYLLSSVSMRFGKAWHEREVLPLPVRIPLPTSLEIEKIAEIIRSSKRPLLLLGSQALLGPVSATELREILDKLCIPTYLTGGARGLLSVGHKNHLMHNRKENLRNSDVVVLAGSVCDFRLSYGRALQRSARIIAMNRNRNQLTLNEGLFWRGELLIQADVASCLKRVMQAMECKGVSDVWEEWMTELARKENEVEQKNEAESLKELRDGFLNPLKFLKELDKALPDDAILIADGGDFVGTAAYIVRARGPLQWLDPGVFGTLGVGAGFAIGAKRIYRDSLVIILYGDGSCGFSLIEFDTFHRHKLPIMAIIGNDACWSQIAREQVPILNSSVAVNLTHANYDQVSAALGGHGEKITIKDKDMLQNILKRTFELTRSGKSVALNVIIGKSDFRKGSTSV